MNGDGSGATVSPVVVAGQITSYTVTNPGAGYTNATIAIQDGLGTGAEATAILGEYGRVLNDYRLRADNSLILAATFKPTGEVLPLSNYNKVGYPAYVYTVNNGSVLTIFRAESSLNQLGESVALPADVGAAPTYVRNPVDGSLLVRTESADNGNIWIPTLINKSTGVVTGCLLYTSPSPRDRG